MSVPEGRTFRIREVWAQNLQEEFEIIREIIDDHPYVAIDTEFPGVVLRPAGVFKTSFDYHYQTLRANVDRMNLIQLGFTFTDEKGCLPDCGNGEHCVWQFNFREFDIGGDDVYAPDSIELLIQCGMNFEKNREKGIDSARFGELLMSSGIVLNEDVHCISFHGAYDFGYLLKLLTCKRLPAVEAEFFDLLGLFFGTFYDVKYMMKFCKDLNGGLDRLAKLLSVKRIGTCHQAGSDSLLTSSVFHKLKDGHFKRSRMEYAGVLYGLGIDNANLYACRGRRSPLTQIFLQ